MYHISVCDDNSGELEKICSIINDYTAVNNISAEIKSFSSGSELLEYEDGELCSDIYILDIIMPDMNGIQLGKAIRQKNANAFIIFLTSSKDYALESYSVKAFSYLIKPVEKEDVTAELAECFSRISIPTERFVLKCSSGAISVRAEDIVYIEYYNHRMIYRLAGGKTVESVYFRETFDSMIVDFIKNGFFIKSSASYLVNMKHIKTVNTVGFIMSDGTLLTVTRKYAEARKKYIDYELNGGNLHDDV
ncbi:MAG: LytTR family DNA-binding domain-containing protein [Oscillospiraceae bacterium]|nr:LytTR family DNA-binding domain-containing protein [Oscillospiraceae bacterium]